MKQFDFIVALCQTNTSLAQNELERKRQYGDMELLTKAEFTRVISKELVENKKWKNNKENYKEI